MKIYKNKKLRLDDFDFIVSVTAGIVNKTNNKYEKIT